MFSPSKGIKFIKATIIFITFLVHAEDFSTYPTPAHHPQQPKNRRVEAADVKQSGRKDTNSSRIA